MEISINFSLFKRIFLSIFSVIIFSQFVLFIINIFLTFTGVFWTFIKDLKIIYLVFLFYFCLVLNSNAKNNLEGTFTDIKILDKISSKNTVLKLKNGELIKFKDLSIKSLKCKNSEFDDNPEITAYIQVRDLTNKNNDEVFVFNGWMFSSSPSITPFDHPVYDVWLVNCY